MPYQEHEYFSELVHPDLLNQLVPVCKTFVRGGTVKQAKHAIKCLFVNLTDSQVCFYLKIYLIP